MIKKYLNYFAIYFTVMLHVSLSLFCVFGWIFPQTYFLNLICVFTFPILWYFHGSCILWDLEKFLRRQINPHFNPRRTFIAHYSNKILGHSLHENTIHALQATIHVFLIIGHIVYLTNRFLL